MGVLRLGVAAAAACLGLVVGGAGQGRPGAADSARFLPFEECLVLIEDVGRSLGVDATAIVNTRDLRLVRFAVSDGSLLVTCSRPDDRIVMVRSPVR